jgi:hypothetical protein
MSVGRHLVHLKWPQVPFFGEGGGVFWQEQIYAYCSSRWPVNAAEQSLGKGISLAVRYGPGAFGLKRLKASLGGAFWWTFCGVCKTARQNIL